MNLKRNLRTKNVIVNCPVHGPHSYCAVGDPTCKAEDVTQQTHYTQFRIQPLEFIGRNKLGFLEGNIIKYVCRYDLKNGLEDLKKARHYLDCLIEREEKGTITL